MKRLFVSLVAAGALLFAAGFSHTVLAADSAPAAVAAAPAASDAASAPAAASAAPAAATAAPAAAPAAAAPVPNKGDTAWMMVATVLVILMTIPGLALFYGGLVRSKNMLSILMQVFMIFSLIVTLWSIYG